MSDVLSESPSMATCHWHAGIQSPVGELLVTGFTTGDSPIHVTSLTFPDHRHPRPPHSHSRLDATPFAIVADQLEEYFGGERKHFDVQLRPAGTDFQMSVWRLLLVIRYGETTTYQLLAQQAGNASASRAVGAAVGRNPISILIPCHRVIATGGKLTGFAGGLERKRQLLGLESNKNV